MRSKPKRLRGILCLAVMLAASVSFPANAQSGSEQISAYNVQIQIERSGLMVVKEVIDYDFGADERHGIFRDVPVKLRYDDKYDRIYPMKVLSVEGSSGTPDDYDVEDQGFTERIKIGDPDKTITGRHSYTIVYQVERAFNGFADHDELYWNAIGDQWPVPIQAATVTVSAPGEVTKIACFAGPSRSTLPCSDATKTGNTARFSQSGLAPYEAFTFVVALPKGAVAAPKPVLRERWSFARAFQVTAFTGFGALALLAGIVAYLTRLIWKSGRDRRWAGSPVDAVFGNDGAEEAVGMFDRGETPVEFEPPESIRPGQVGTLVDEVAGPLDVTASIVDLAVRRYLVIEEVEKKGLFGKQDWNLKKLKAPAEKLRAYEKALLKGLFEDGDEVKLSDLRNTFAARLTTVENDLYDDAVSQGWFATRPDKIRTRWLGIGIGALIVSLGILVVAAIFTHVALLGIPLVAGSLLLLGAAKRMPRRTAKGTAVLRRIQGFRRFIDESERDRARFAEKQNLFSEYLPYAIVFGATKKWARAFEGLDGALPTTYWYAGNHPFTAMAFASSIDGFAVTTSGTITSTPSGSGASGFSGGGFSGGGGGGGGGGSW
ncbi:MAG: DUF2207 domain-containing protein [Actinomycetota bacterium]